MNVKWFHLDPHECMWEIGFVAERYRRRTHLSAQCKRCSTGFSESLAARAAGSSKLWKILKIQKMIIAQVRHLFPSRLKRMYCIVVYSTNIKPSSKKMHWKMSMRVSYTLMTKVIQFPDICAQFPGPNTLYSLPKVAGNRKKRLSKKYNNHEESHPNNKRLAAGR